MKTFLSRHLLFNLALFSLQKCFCFVTTTSKQQQQQQQKQQQCARVSFNLIFSSSVLIFEGKSNFDWFVVVVVVVVVALVQRCPIGFPY
jgi:hypothetical protein